MQFASDNWAGASPAVLAAIAREAEGIAPAYGRDDATRRLGEVFAELFGRPVGFFTTPTGTAANALSLAALATPGSSILSHATAHIVGDESGAAEFFTLGARLVPIPGAAGKLTPDGLAAALDRLLADDRAPRPAALSLTQATECGTVYRPEELAGLAAMAHRAGLAVHMDGARFANAVAFLGVDPAEITWRAGVDVLSFGGTKTGALMAEAVVFFDPARAEGLDWRRRRGGHIVSKARLIAAQFLGLLEGGHWLDLARHANAMARRLADGLRAQGHRIPWPVEANEVFPILPDRTIERLRAAGATFYAQPRDLLPPEEAPATGETMIRLVASFATTEAEVEGFLEVSGE
jgi:threonine aldolase